MLEENTIIKVFQVLVDKIEAIHEHIDSLDKRIIEIDGKVKRICMTNEEKFLDIGFHAVDFTDTKVRKEFEGNDTTGVSWLFELNTDSVMGELFEIEEFSDVLVPILGEETATTIKEYVEEHGDYGEIMLSSMGIESDDYVTLVDYVMDALVRTVAPTVKLVKETYPGYFEVTFSQDGGGLYRIIQDVGTMLEKLHLRVNGMSVMRG